MPNRVCVALSRAKIGLFCLANIDFLAKHSDLWKKIRQSLDKIGAVQSALPVKCAAHGFEQVYFVFLKGITVNLAIEIH